jgi:tetratricopeptide (TPR) repeat protein
VHESVALRPLGDPRWATVATEAVQLLEGLPPSVELVEALVQRSLVELASFEGTGDGVRALSTRAIEVASGLGLAPPALAFARRGFSRAGAGDPGALDDMRHALELAAGEPATVEVRVTSDFGGAEIYFGGIVAAEARVRDAIGLARRRGLGGVLDHMETNLVYVLRARGKWDEAMAFAPAVLDVDWPAEHWMSFHIRAMELGLIFAERGDLRSLDALLARMRPVAPEASFPADHTRALLEAPAGALLHDAPRVVAAVAMIPTVEGDRDFDGRYATEYPILARAVLAVGQPELLERFTGSIAAQAPLARATRRLLEGYLAAGLGRHDEAAEAFRSAGDQLAEWGFVPEATHARHWLAAAELALGRKATAVAILAAARRVWQELGAVPALRDCDRLMAVASASPSDLPTSAPPIVPAS